MNAHKQMPVLRTERLVIRPYTLEDASDLQRLIGDRAVAATTARVPHPYEDGMAEEFIGKQQQNFDEEKSLNLAITHREDGCLIGGIGLEFDTSRESAELGYWIGKPCWGIGYATEAAQAMVEHGFGTRGLCRIHATHFGNNPASGRVMQKIGMKCEGCRRQHFKKWDEFVDLVLYGMLRSECEAVRKGSR